MLSRPGNRRSRARPGPTRRLALLSFAGRRPNRRDVRARDASEPRPLTSWRVLVAILALVGTTVGVSVWGVAAQIRSRVVGATVQSTTVITSLVVDRSITFTDLRDGIHPRNRAKLDADVFLMKERGLVLGLRVWELVHGDLVYADPDHQGDGTHLAADELNQARAGRPFARDSVDDHLGDTFTVYYPYDANGDGDMDAAAEVILHRRDVDESVATSTRILYGGAAVALVLALLGIQQVRRRQVVQDRLAAHDSLTGLGNRVLLARRAQPLLAAATADVPVGLLLVDLDGFKGVNDSLGHQAGDDLLVAVAAAIRGACRPEDTAIRLGGDEFAVLLPRTDPPTALELAGRIRQALRRPVQIAGLTVEIDASIGVAWAPAHHRELSPLLHCADVAMYQAKQSGGGVTAYDPADDVQSDRSVTLVPELRRAMQAGLVELHYQPIVPVAGPVREVEALLRWRHPRRGLLDAVSFLPQVERTSLVRPLTEWMLDEAAAAVARWRAAGQHLQVAVNISSRSLLEPALARAVREATAAAGLPPTALRLESAEAALAGDAVAESTVAALCDLAVPLTIDGASGAFAALSALGDAVPDQFKIHPSLVATAPANEMARQAVAGLTRFADLLGVTVVADGVDSEAVGQVMTDLGCHALQGRAVCPPIPGDELLGWLAGAGAGAGVGRPAWRGPGRTRVPSTTSASFSEGTVP
jgi:diguanylate cyclase (GGDEF)-like protein